MSGPSPLAGTTQTSATFQFTLSARPPSQRKLELILDSIAGTSPPHRAGEDIAYAQIKSAFAIESLKARRCRP